MLGKRNRRAGSFSTCHATVLVGFMLLAHLLGLGAARHHLELSDTAGGQPSGSPQLCVLNAHRSDDAQSCTVLIKTSYHGSGKIGVIVWQHGTDL